MQLGLCQHSLLLAAITKYQRKLMAPKKCDAFSNWFWSYLHHIFLWFLGFIIRISWTEATERRWYCKTFLWMGRSVTEYLQCFHVLLLLFLWYENRLLSGRIFERQVDVINILPLFGRNDSCSVFNACRLSGHPPLYYHSMKGLVFASYILFNKVLLPFWMSAVLKETLEDKNQRKRDSWMYENIKQMQSF